VFKIASKAVVISGSLCRSKGVAEKSGILNVFLQRKLSQREKAKKKQKAKRIFKANHLETMPKMPKVQPGNSESTCSKSQHNDHDHDDNKSAQASLLLVHHTEPTFIKR